MGKERFFIRDCHGNIAGNPKGYRTFRGANAQADSVKTTTGRALWATHEAHVTAQEKAGRTGWQIDRLIFSIALEKVD